MSENTQIIKTEDGLGIYKNGKEVFVPTVLKNSEISNLVDLIVFNPNKPDEVIIINGVNSSNTSFLDEIGIKYRVIDNDRGYTVFVGDE